MCGLEYDILQTLAQNTHFRFNFQHFDDYGFGTEQENHTIFKQGFQGSNMADFAGPQYYLTESRFQLAAFSNVIANNKMTIIAKPPKDVPVPPTIFRYMDNKTSVAVVVTVLILGMGRIFFPKLYSKSLKSYTLLNLFSALFFLVAGISLTLYSNSLSLKAYRGDDFYSWIKSRQNFADLLAAGQLKVIVPDQKTTIGQLTMQFLDLHVFPLMEVNKKAKARASTVIYADSNQMYMEALANWTNAKVELIGLHCFSEIMYDIAASNLCGTLQVFDQPWLPTVKFTLDLVCIRTLTCSKVINR